MLDRTIPFYNTILRCDSCRREEISLPEGFTIVPYRPGYEKEWARLEHSIGDFSTPEEAEAYFVATYLQDPRRYGDILFAVGEDGFVAGACIAWQDERQGTDVASLHWLVVDETCRGLGLGRALCRAVMDIFAARDQFPVYIHTQPWSWKAIFLYLSLGFRLQRSDTFSHYINEYPQAMEALADILPKERFEILLEHSDDGEKDSP